MNARVECLRSSQEIFNISFVDIVSTETFSFLLLFIFLFSAINFLRSDSKVSRWEVWSLIFSFLICNNSVLVFSCLLFESDLLYWLKISETHLEQLWKPFRGWTWFLSVIFISSYKDVLSLFNSLCSLHPGLSDISTLAITSRMDFSSGENTGSIFCGPGKSWLPEKLRTFRAGRLNTKFGISVNRLLSSKMTSTLGCRHREVGMKIRRLFLINKSIVWFFMLMLGGSDHSLFCNC